MPKTVEFEEDGLKIKYTQVEADEERLERLFEAIDNMVENNIKIVC